ncbi:MAG TPA: hypothetical protein PKZ42_09555 [Syntrophales bacterium]|nr:hypothetical protein [Syntrophales bacterium]
MQHNQAKHIIFLSLFGLFLASLAISFHHHEKSFSTNDCSVCKVKASLNGTFNNIRTDFTPAAVGLRLLSVAIFLRLSGMIPNDHTVFVDSHFAVTYPNKAPPLTV